jgi:hypothetical protein
MGFAAGCSEWAWRREKGPRHGVIVWLLFGRGRVRQGGGGGQETGPTRGGSGARAGEGVHADRRAQATCAMRVLLAEQRGWGEANGWATATVPGGGVTDEWGL